MTAGLLACMPVSGARATVDFAPRITVHTEERPTTTAVADVTGDGIADLLTGTDRTSDLILHPGRGGGAFASSVAIPVGDTVRSIATGDFDEDGDRDIVAGTLDRSLRLVVMDGHGLVSRTETFLVGGVPVSVETGDLNADGHADLVVVNSESRNASILLGRGAGGFAQSVYVDIGDFPIDAALVDVTDDGVLDIVAATTRPAGVTISPGNGDGTFARATRLGAGLEPSAVAVADFDRDGHRDIATTNLFSNDVTVQRGIGAGRFVPGGHWLTSSLPADLTVGDWNGDGLLDVATANSGSGDISVLEGNGSGGFRPAQQFQVGPGPVHLTSADATGDGQPDLVVANGSGASLSILSPRAFTPPGTAKRRVRCPAARLRAVALLETRCATLTMTRAQVREVLGAPRGARSVSGGTAVRWHYRKLLVTFSRKLNMVTEIRTLTDGAHTVNGASVGTFVGDLKPRLSPEASCFSRGRTQTCVEFSFFTATRYA
jgi:hypothetical protein